MDLRQLRSFVAVAEELSFRRAAERLHVSQPPLSRQIQALEEELGVRLLDRDRRKQVVLTDAGHTFLADARLALATADAAAERAQEGARGVRGRLNIANISSLSAKVLPRLLSEFHRQSPDVEVSVVEMTRGEQLAALRDGRIHLGIYPDLGASLDRRFQSQPLFSCPMVVVLPADHDLAKDVTTTEIDVKALVGMTLVVFPSVMIAIPLFVIFNGLGLVNTYPGLIFADSAICLPFAITILRPFFRSIPKELSEAARIDGCGLMNAFRLIILPLSKPAVLTVGIFSFLAAWGDLLMALTLNTDEAMRPVTSELFKYMGNNVSQWNMVMGFATLECFPRWFFFSPHKSMWWQD